MRRRQPSPRCDVKTAVDGEVMVVTVSGNADLSHAELLRRAFASAARTGRPLLVDFAACTFMDSTSLACLMRLVRVAEDGGQRLAVACPAGAPRRLFELAAPGQFPLHATRAEALATFARR